MTAYAARPRQTMSAARPSSGTSAPPGDTRRLLARDHTAPEPTLLLAKAAEHYLVGVRALAWCSRPRSGAASPGGALAVFLSRVLRGALRHERPGFADERPVAHPTLERDVAAGAKHVRHGAGVGDRQPGGGAPLDVLDPKAHRAPAPLYRRDDLADDRDLPGAPLQLARPELRRAARDRGVQQEDGQHRGHRERDYEACGTGTARH